MHVPPKFNQYDRRQLWVVELEDSRVDEVINGMLFAVLVASVLYIGGLAI